MKLTKKVPHLKLNLVTEAETCGMRLEFRSKFRQEFRLQKHPASSLWTKSVLVFSSYMLLLYFSALTFFKRAWLNSEMALKDEKCSNFEDNLKIVRQVPIPKIVDESKLGDVLSQFNHLMTQGTFTKCTLFLNHS